MNIIKLSEIEDIDRVLSLDYQAIKDFFVLIKNTYSQDDILRAWRYNAKTFYTALVDNTIIGLCGFRKLNRTTAEMLKLRIDKSMRRKGYGSEMVRFIEQKIIEAGCSKIVFSTAALREGTLRFYENLGYEQTGEGLIEKLRVYYYEKLVGPQVCESSAC